MLASLGKHGTMWSCLTFIICLFPALIKSLRTSLPGELRLAHTHLALAGKRLNYYYYQVRRQGRLLGRKSSAWLLGRVKQPGAKLIGLTHLRKCERDGGLAEI